MPDKHKTFCFILHNHSLAKTTKKTIFLMQKPVFVKQKYRFVCFLVGFYRKTHPKLLFII